MLLSCVKRLNLLVDKPLHLFPLRQLQLIPGYEQLIVHTSKGVFGECVIFVSAEQNADWRIVSLSHHVGSVPANVRVELAQILVAEAFDFEFDQDMAFQNSVVKDQVDKKVLVTNQNSLLPSFETEAMPELQQERLQPVDKLLFEVRLAHNLGWFQAKELKYIRIADV